MPIIVTKSGIEYNLVPAPLVTFNKQVYNNVGRPGFGSDYTVTLQGTLLPTHGNPTTTGLSTADWTRSSNVESEEVVALSGLQLLDVTIKKQEYIRNLFTNPTISGIAQPIKVQIKGWNEAGAGSPGSGLIFYGFVDDLSFDSDSRWANPTTYTVNLRTSSFISSANVGTFQIGNENVQSGYWISNLTDTFDIQEDGRSTLTFRDVVGGMKKIDKIDKVYSINRSITAVGSPVYDTGGGYLNGLSPWQQASGFLHAYLKVGSGNLYETNLSGIKSNTLGQFTNGLYKAANFVYQESIDKEAGSYSITETFLLYSGLSPVIENITINHDVAENGINTVAVQGTIQGLNTISGFFHSGNAFINAYTYLTGVIDTGVPSTAYYYARGIMRGVSNLTENFVPWLHPRPLSKSFAHDLNAGSISYTYSFDDRPANIIPGSISESIQINDTYPGELFSVTPVIGRSQPVLQYLNSRSEYKRNLSINITMGQTGDPTFLNVNNVGNISDSASRRSVLQRMFINEKPSISQTAALNDIFQAANPVNDPTFTVANGKCFHSAPTETWDPRTRNYSYSIEWTYERITNV